MIFYCITPKTIVMVLILEAVYDHCRERNPKQLSGSIIIGSFGKRFPGHKVTNVLINYVFLKKRGKTFYLRDLT